MRLAEELLAGAPGAARFATAYNFGPNEDDARPVSWIAERMTSFWGDGASWVLDDDHGPHEAGYLRLDSSRARRDLGVDASSSTGDCAGVARSVVSGLAVGLGVVNGNEMQALTVSQISAYTKLLTREF